MTGNFNDPESERGFIPNLGSAGSDYDLALGQVARAPGKEEFARFYKGAGEVYPFFEPIVAESTDSRLWTPASKALDESAPVVVSALPGSTTLIDAFDVRFNFSAAPTFNSTLITWATSIASGQNVMVHILPRVAPLFPTGAWGAKLSRARGLEDQPKWVQLWALTPLSAHPTFRVTTLPTAGRLYEVENFDSDERNKNLTLGESLTGRGRWLLYVPDTEYVGQDLFGFTVTLQAMGLTSEERMITLQIGPVNDLPAARRVDASVSEDAGPTLVNLDAPDPDPGSIVDLIIVSLPRKGKLYTSSDGSSNGTLTPITIGASGTEVEQ